MLSPLPRKAFKTSCGVPTSPAASCPCPAGFQDLSTPRPFWHNVDDEATKDLRAVLACETPKKALPDWMPAFESRCLSSASTCAMSPAPPSTASPPYSPDLAVRSDPSTYAMSPQPPSSTSQPCSPDHAFSVRSEGIEDIGFPTLSKKTQCPPGAPDKSSWLQARKVFVGGIPQTLDQNGLYHIFSKYGKVKKAWLQLFHADRAAEQASRDKKHRGFGFVIFYEKHAIDQLIGADFSRFLCIDDLKLEIKRAIGKSPEEQSLVGSTAAKLEHSSSIPSQGGTPVLTQQGQSHNTAQDEYCRRGTQAEIYRNMMLASPQHWQSSSPTRSQETSPQYWQRAPSQAMLVGCQAYVSLPWVPAFPCASSAPTLPPQANSLEATLLTEFLGQAPRNCEELTQTLLNALPEHYDD